MNGEDVARAVWRASEVGATSGETAILTAVPSRAVGIGTVRVLCVSAMLKEGYMELRANRRNQGPGEPGGAKARTRLGA